MSKNLWWKCYFDKFPKVIPNEKCCPGQIYNVDKKHGTGAKFLETPIMTTAERTPTGNMNGKSC